MSTPTRSCATARISGASVLVLAAMLASRTALAQEFERVEGHVSETIPAAPFLAAAYGFIWVAVVVYLVMVARRLGGVRADIEDLKKRLAGGPK